MVRFMGAGGKSAQSWISWLSTAKHFLHSSLFNSPSNKSPSPVYCTKEKKESPHTKTPIHIVWKTKQVLNAAPLSAPPQIKRKRGSSENILGKTNTIEAGVKSEITNFYTKS